MINIIFSYKLIHCIYITLENFFRKPAHKSLFFFSLSFFLFSFKKKKTPKIYLNIYFLGKVPPSFFFFFPIYLNPNFIIVG